MTETARERFGRIVRARREGLGLQQTDLKDRGGPSSTTMSLVERGLQEPTQLVLRRLDAGLDWEPGSAARAIAGGEPTPLVPARRPDPRVSMDRFYALAPVPRNLTGWSATVTVLRNQLQDGSITPDYAIVLATEIADQMIDVLLKSGAGPEARPILQRLILDRQELQERGFDNDIYWNNTSNEETSHAMEVAPESPASPEGDQGKEDLGPKKLQDRDGRSLNFGGTAPADDTTMDGTEDGEEGHDLPGA